MTHDEARDRGQHRKMWPYLLRKPMKRANWSRRLPQPLSITGLMTLTTLDDVRTLMKHLPAEHRNRPTWQHVAAQIDDAARGGDVDDAVVALRLVLSLERIECRPR